MALREPVVRIRCSAGDEARCRDALARAGLGVERVLTWLVVREADPDLVNEALASGGADARVAVRAAMGKLVGWLIDREGRLEGRGRNVAALVSRVIEEGGLAQRYTMQPEPALLAAAAELHRFLVESGAGFVSWERFVALFLVPRAAGS
jgi:hypothetical protein